MNTKLVITGANGFLGQALIRFFAPRFKTVVAISRKSFPCTCSNVTQHIWDARNIGAWTIGLEDADVLINLAGKNVNCRYTEENRKEILRSRIESTALLARAIDQCASPPKAWLNASSATIYNASFETDRDEDSSELGDDFSMSVCRQWEETFFNSGAKNIRKVALRTSIVLGNDGGAFPVLKRLVNFGLGGAQGDGKQFCSWIHETDFCRAVEFIINSTGDGIYNVTSPLPIPNRRFMETLAGVMDRPLQLPSPKALLEFGAIFIGTETELVLKSRKVIPKRLVDEGFSFEFPNVKDAFIDLCQTSVRKPNNTLSR